MSTRIQIVWDGTAPGLQEHELSLAAFGEALPALLTAMRRIASSIEREARDSEYGAKGGKFTRTAECLDVRITKLNEGSLKLALALAITVPVGSTLPMWLEQECAQRFVEHVEAESAGTPRSAAVRRFLHALPEGIRRQEYVAYAGDRVLRETKIVDMHLPEEPRDLPRLVELTGLVIGVGFEPGRTEVRIKTDDGTTTLSASEALVEAALGLRAGRVRALALEHGKPRLLRVRAEGTPQEVLAPAERTQLLLQRWSGALARLAR